MNGAREAKRREGRGARRSPGAKQGGAIALALLALALLPGSALAGSHALSVHLYRVLYEGSGSYDVRLSDQGGVSAHEQAGFHWKVAYTPMVIAPRRGWRVGMTTLRSGSSGGGEWSISSNNGGEESCAKSGGLKLAPRGEGSGVRQGDGLLPLELTPGNSDFTTSGGDPGPGPCDTTDFWQDWVRGFSHVGAGGAEIHDPLTAFVTLTPADLRAGRVTVNVSNVTFADPGLQVSRDCGSGDGATCVQDFSWKGRVTITRARSARPRRRSTR